MIPDVFAGGDVVRRQLAGADFASAREALVEAIEAEGLVVGAVLPINEMLARTAGTAELHADGLRQRAGLAIGRGGCGASRPMSAGYQYLCDYG